MLPDGGRVRFDRISAGTLWTNAVYQNTTNPGSFYGATIAWNGNGWTLTEKNGTALIFPESFNASSPQQAALITIRDRNGNTVTLTRDSSSHDLTRVTSPNGRYISFTYDTNHRITQAQDNIGRTVQYVYDGPGLSGRLSQVTDANLGVWQYGYNASNQMTTIRDARNILYLTNEYANNRVSRQTQADSTTYQFAYTTDANDNVIQTDVTDPRNHVRRIVFNPPPVSPSGFQTGAYDASDTFAYGLTNQQTSSTIRQPGTNLPTSTTDALGRTTSYTYDGLGNVTSITRLAGTPQAVTTTFTYDTTYSQVTSVTDPLGHTTKVTYDTKGNLTSVTDPLGNTSGFTYNLAGRS